MTVTPNLRKFTLTLHITASIGWIGAVAGFLALAIAGLISQNAEMVRASYLAMGLITWFVIVPLALASLLTGIVSSVSTRWGLLRHYWVLVKLLVTIVSITILLVHMQPINVLADAAEKMAEFSADLHGPRIMMVVASSASLPVLFFLTALSVYKLRGVTPYGTPKQSGTGVVAKSEAAVSTPQWVKVFGIIVIVLVVLFVVLHLTGNSLGGSHFGG